MSITLPVTALYVPLLRTEEHEEFTLVEGYAYVNGKVKSDKYNLLRSTVETMTAEWMTDGPTIDEMHRMDTASGVGIDTAWDDKGLKITAKVVDTEARKKVKHGVYRGFSVMVIPTKVKGTDVVAGRMPRISLVDRPADPDAKFTCVRSASEEIPAEVEVDDENDETIPRGAFADAMKKQEARVLRSRAIETLSGVLYDALCYGEGDAQSRTLAMDTALNEFRAYVLPMMARGERFIELATDPPIARAEHDAEVQRRDTQISALQSERDEAQTLVRSQEGEIARLKTENKRLEETPVAPPPTRYPAALQRQFSANEQERTEADEARAEIERIDGLSRDEIAAMPEAERGDLAVKRMRLERIAKGG